MNFKPGQTITLDENQPAWNYLPQFRKRLLCFLFEHDPQEGHCAVIDLASGKITTMLHIDDFRAVTENEC